MSISAYQRRLVKACAAAHWICAHAVPAKTGARSADFAEHLRGQQVHESAGAFFEGLHVDAGQRALFEIECIAVATADEQRNRYAEMRLVPHQEDALSRFVCLEQGEDFGGIVIRFERGRCLDIGAIDAVGIGDGLSRLPSAGITAIKDSIELDAQFEHATHDLAHPLEPLNCQRA